MILIAVAVLSISFAISFTSPAKVALEVAKVLDSRCDGVGVHHATCLGGKGVISPTAATSAWPHSHPPPHTSDASSAHGGDGGSVAEFDDVAVGSAFS